MGHNKGNSRQAEKRKAKRKLDPSGFVMTRSEENANLADVVAMLNDDSAPERDLQGTRYEQDDVARLCRMVRAWQEVEREPGGYMPRMWKLHLSPEDRERLERFTKSLHVYFAPDLTMKVHDETFKPHDRDAIQFTRLIRNSQGWRLRGPCPGITNGKVCGKWFVRKDRHERKFCQRKCAANAAKSSERERTHKAMLARASHAIADYVRLSLDREATLGREAELDKPMKHASLVARPKIEHGIKQYRRRWNEVIDCKGWKEAVNHVTGISKKFLTAAVKNGELTPPGK